MATMHTHPKFSAVGSIPRPSETGELPASVQAEPSEPPSVPKRWLERVAERVARSKLQLLFRKRGLIAAELRLIPARMQRVTNQARLVLELSEDFRSGAYRSISWLSIAVAAVCLVYAVSPADIVPDTLPGLGSLDDMIVITLGMRFLQRDLRAYCRFKGYPESDYFDVTE